MVAKHERYFKVITKSIYLYCSFTAVSIGGSLIQRAAIGWFVWQETHSPMWVSFISASDLIPTFVISLFAGVAVDRSSPRCILLFSQILGIAQAFALLILYELSLMKLVTICLMNVISGVASAYYVPSRISYLSSMAETEDKKRVFAISSAFGNLSFLFAPMLLWSILRYNGIEGVLEANIVSYIPLILFLILSRLKGHTTDTILTERGPSCTAMISQGVSIIVADKQVLSSIFSFTFLLTCARGAIELAPAVAAKFFSGEVFILSLLGTAFGVGAVSGSVLMTALPKTVGRYLTTSTTLLIAAPITGIYLASANFYIVVCCSYVIGALLSTNNIIVTSVIQSQILISARGRVNGIYGLLLKAGPAGGALLLGCMVQNIGMIGSGATIGISTLLLWIVYLRISR